MERLKKSIALLARGMCCCGDKDVILLVLEPKNLRESTVESMKEKEAELSLSLDCLLDK